MAILARSPKPAFSVKVQREDEGKFFKNRLKSSPRLNGQKHSAVRGIIPELVCSEGARTGGDFGAENGSKSARMAQLRQCKVTLNPHFLKKCKGGTKGNFSKIAPKEALVRNG